MEMEQRYVVSYLYRKEMKPPAIVAELAAVYHENAFNENRVQYWPHEIKVIVLIRVTDRAPAGPLLKVLMLEFCKSWKLSHVLRFERSLSSSKFLRRRCISI
jgi:hypothetical protein